MSQPENVVDKKDEAISALTLKNMELEKLLEAQRILSANFKSQVDAIVEEIKGYIKLESIARFVVKSFEEGRVPVPVSITERNLPISVYCEDRDIRFDEKNGLLADVTFRYGHLSGIGTRQQLTFLMSIVPDESVKVGYYPDFPRGWSKDLNKKKPTLKPSKTE